MRKQARENCFKAIYATMFTEQENVLDYINQEDSLNETDINFSKALFDLWMANKEQIKDTISQNLSGYEYERVYKVDLALISLALTEILFYKETPKPVVINEIVEISKKYSTEKSYSFINGILKNILKE